MVDEQGAVVLQYVSTPEEYAEGAASWARRRQAAQRRRLLLIGVVGAGLGVLLGSWVVVGCGVAVAVLTATSAQLRSAYRRSYKANPWHAQPWTTRVGAEGISAASTGFEIRFAWTRLPEVDVTRRTVVFGGPTGLTIIPRRALTDDELERAVAWARAGGAAVSRSAT